MKRILFFISIACIAVACNESFQAKPKGYKNLDLPKVHTYQSFADTKYPYSFEYPTYATVLQDSTFFSENPQNDNWINLDFGKYNCKVYLSYSAINGVSVYKKLQANGQYKDSVAKNSFDKLVQDAFNLTSKHDIKASGKDDKLIKSSDGSGGVFFYLGGQVASPIQFFLTDTSSHFVRGALYYNASPNPDSTRPLTQFIENDIEHLIKTFKWNK